MKCPTKNTIATMVLSIIVCLFQAPVTYTAEQRSTRREPTPQAANVGDLLAGEWRVRCEVTTYRNGEVSKVSREDDESLVVIETDSDGSYQLFKFPVGFGEGFPRVRRVSEGRYSGDETIRGIEILVQQVLDLEGGQLTIRQTVIDSRSRQRQSETVCRGRRSAGGAVAAGRSAEVCASASRPSDLPGKSLSLRYKLVQPFSDGLAAAAVVSRGEHKQKWGFIDATGRVVIPMRYDVVTSFCGGLAAVGKYYGHGRNLKWGIVERIGPQVTPHVNYDTVKILGGGLAAVGYAVPGRPGIRWNLINRENTTIFYGFDEIGCLVDGRAEASYTDGNTTYTGYINKVGEFFAEKKR